MRQRNLHSAQRSVDFHAGRGGAANLRVVHRTSANRYRCCSAARGSTLPWWVRARRIPPSFQDAISGRRSPHRSVELANTAGRIPAPCSLRAEGWGGRLTRRAWGLPRQGSGSAEPSGVAMAYKARAARRDGGPPGDSAILQSGIDATAARGGRAGRVPPASLQRGPGHPRSRAPLRRRAVRSVRHGRRCRDRAARNVPGHHRGFCLRRVRSRLDSPGWLLSDAADRG